MTKILLVEDDKSLREIYGTRLYAEGYEIVSAGDGEEALAMAIKERPGLILSDVMMPKISGFDMLDILRSTTETRDIKVIMMTALSSEDQRQRGESLGADRYLVKSQVGIEDVVRTVHEVLGDAPATDANPSQAPATAPPTPTVPPPPPPAPEPSPEVSLPQPTAPFSTPRPSGLGDRVIQPLTSTENNDNSLADRLNEELNAAPAQAPAAPPPPVSAPQVAAPQPPAPAPNPTPPAPAPSQPVQSTETPQVAPAAVPPPSDNAPQPQADAAATPQQSTNATTPSATDDSQPAAAPPQPATSNTAQPSPPPPPPAQ